MPCKQFAQVFFDFRENPGGKEDWEGDELDDGLEKFHFLLSLRLQESQQRA